MRCLFLTEDHPLSANAPGGGPATIRHHLDLLLDSRIETTLVILRGPNESLGFEAFVARHPGEWAGIRDRCASTIVQPLQPSTTRFRAASRLASACISPITYLTSAIDPASITELHARVDADRTDFIWAENLTPAALALQVAGGKPVIYSHHDWIWRVWTHSARARAAGFRALAVCRLMKRGEERLVRRVSGIVSTSTTETADLGRFNSRVEYVPPSYPLAELEDSAPPSRAAHVVHVGGMATMSNRLGLERFLDVAWPRIGDAGRRPELMVIGSLAHAPQSLLEKLAQAGAELPGFVEDLRSVLRPYDIHIVPWEHDTGTRMKIPLALNHAQVVVATRATASCLPELIDGDNCVLVETLDDMGPVVAELLGDERRRRAIGNAARRTFVRHYTHAAVLPGFANVLSRLISAPVEHDPAVRPEFQSSVHGSPSPSASLKHPLHPEIRSEIPS